jgi:phage baseplate assembly protein W
VAEGAGTGPRGERLFRRAWGWSMSSAADALDVAHDQLRTALARVGSGARVGGYYPRAPLREPILDELIVDGQQVLAVTRNRYGAEILNTDHVLIADVDLPEMREPSAGGMLRRLFGRRAAETEPPSVVERLAAIGTWARTNPGLGVTVYRTASGLRVFVTGVEEPASSARGGQILAELDADPIYRELCRAHGTFRARLTPKPWRLPGMTAPRERWPFPDGNAERLFHRWLARYETAARGYAVCRLLDAHGPAPSILDERIIRLHDQRTGVHTPLPLPLPLA